MIGASDITRTRKDEHLSLCLEQDVKSSSGTLLNKIQLKHRAIPDIDFSKISLQTDLLNLKISCPILVSSMTGGSDRGDAINEVLARFAQEKNIPMGVGSQRVLLEDRSAKHFALRKAAPNAILFANLGLVQLNYGVTTDDCLWLTDTLQASAFIFHCNPLQEAIQREGDRNFEGLMPKLAAACKKLPVPVILKETGCGMDTETALRAIDAGVACIDVAGLGGTHWGFIEGLRDQNKKRLGYIFRDWGTNTAEATKSLEKSLPKQFPIIASGGIETGLDVAKVMALGATTAGIARPFLEQAAKGESALHGYFDELTESLKIAMFCTGSKNPNEMRGRYEQV